MVGMHLSGELSCMQTGLASFFCLKIYAVTTSVCIHVQGKKIYGVHVCIPSNRDQPIKVTILFSERISSFLE